LVGVVRGLVAWIRWFGERTKRYREREGQREGIKKTTRERRGGDIGSKRIIQW
jgi:hypothetical protein